MEIPQLTLREFRRNAASTFFEQSYLKLQLIQTLEEEEISNLLKNAIVFTNFGDIDLQKLGYKILVSYSIQYNDFKPLYDFSINKG